MLFVEALAQLFGTNDVGAETLQGKNVVNCGKWALWLPVQNIVVNLKNGLKVIEEIKTQEMRSFLLMKFILFGTGVFLKELWTQNILKN